MEILCDESGQLSAGTLAQRLIRALEREAAASPGDRLVGRCAPAVAAAAQPLAGALAERIGARFTIIPEAGFAADHLEAGRA